MTDFVFEKGESITTGSAGEHDFVFAGGESVTDTGESSAVFEAGTGLGGFALVYNDTNVGYWSTNESHQEFFEPIGSPATQIDAQGLLDEGVPTTGGGYHLTVFAHYSETSGTFAVGGVIWEENQTDSGDYRIVYGGFANHDGTLVAFEGSSSGDDVGTSGGDRVHDGDISSRGNGDATLFRVDGSFTSNISVSTGEGADIVIAGPSERVFTGSTSVDVDIVGNQTANAYKEPAPETR